MKGHSKRWLSMLVVLCMIFTLAVPMYAAAQTEDITILYTNDIHTYINNGQVGDGDQAHDSWSYSRLASYKESLGENTLLVDCGDHIQGTAYGSMDDGKNIIELMKSAGYDLATLGNHEFDYGMMRALDVAQNGGFPYVSCNFYEEKDGIRGDNVLDSYKIFERDGVKIAFVGITTPESFTKSTPSYFQDENGNYIYGISGGSDGKALYDDVQKSIDEAKAAGADYVIALGHLGIDTGSAPWRSTDVIANTSGLDAFIDGHSHSTVESDMIEDKDGNQVLLTQTGSYFGAVGKMTISADGVISTQLIEYADGVDREAATASIEDKWIADIETKLGVVVGHADVTLDNYDDDGNRLVRMQETNTGDFAADALYYLFDNMDLDVDVAVMNGGGIRNTAITGDISYLSCKDIHTFGNVACLQTVTGQQLLDALEWGAKDYPGESGGFLHVSGMTYEINPYIESTVQKDEKGVWTGGPTGEYRVRNVMIYDKDTDSYKPLDVNAKYNLAGYNYTLRDLGDGFAMFDGAVNVLDYVMEDYMVLANYIESFPVDADSGLPTITAENSPYADVNGEGRITAKCSHDVEEAEVSGAVSATCTEDGYTGDRTCPTCKEVIKGETVKALGHEYKDGKCVRCGVAEAAVSENQAQTPKTGDENQMGLYMIAMILASACLAGTAVTVKNKR